MSLIKTSMLSLIATAIKMLSGLIINKVVSLIIGPGGLALIGQFQSFLQITQKVGQLGINTGVTKYTAEYRDDNEHIKNVWSTSLKITVCASVITSLVIFVFSGFFSKLIFNDVSYIYVFILLSFTLVLFSLNQLLLSIVNGLKEIPFFISVNITQSIVALIYTTSLIYYYGIDGALIAIATNQSIVFCITILRLKNHKKIIIDSFKNEFDKGTFKKLSKFTIMALTTAVVVPLSHIYIRDYIHENLSLKAAGFWQAIWYISTMYLTVVTTALSTYYLPRISECKNAFEIKSELFNGFKVIIPIVCVISLCIYSLRDYLIIILFSPEFVAISDLFKWQLIGDVVKVGSWLLGCIFVAKAQVKLVVFSEVVFSLSFILFSVSLVNYMGLKGMPIAYFINYVCHFAFMYINLKRLDLI